MFLTKIAADIRTKITKNHITLVKWEFFSRYWIPGGFFPRLQSFTTLTMNGGIFCIDLRRLTIDWEFKDPFLLAIISKNGEFL